MLCDVYKRIGMNDFDTVRSHLESYAERQKGYKKNKYTISRREARLVRDRWGNYLRRWQYDLPENVTLID